jgi:hypothetical protein
MKIDYIYCFAKELILIRALDRVDLADALAVTFFGQLGRKPGGDDLLDLGERVLAAAERQDVGAVVFARIDGERDRITGGGADVRHFIGGHRAADAGAVDDDAGVRLAFADGARDGVREIRVIDRLFRIGPEIADFEAELGEINFERFLEFEAAVIAAERDGADFDAGSTNTRRKSARN